MSEVAIKVAVRVRPFSRREMEQNQKNIIRVLDTQNLVFDPEEDEDEFFFHGAKQTHRDITKRVKKKLSMEFDSVFSEEADNENVFEVLTKPLITSVLDGFNCSVFVYGATGAGKTFTMLGSEDNPGLTYLTMRHLFAVMEEKSKETKYDIGISYLEVYNEQVMNLLTKSGPLKLREDSKGVVVGGLVLKQIYNADELFDLLILGNKNRTQHPTDANEESSRSHAIFQVHIRMTDKKNSVRRTVKLSMIDLAGSERAQSTKCKGLRFKEGANINKSLLALGNCINRLADGSKHIPYRDSNLTRILKDSLGGNCQTLMIANISPSSLTYEDTYNTLKYAGRAKTIRTTCRQNIITSNVPKEFLLKKCNEQVSEIEKLRAENEKLKERNKMLEAQLLDQKSVAQMTNGAGDMPSPDLSAWYAKIDNAHSTYKKAHEKCMTLQSCEKVLTFRIGFKEKHEEVKKILTLDGSRVEMDLSKLEASIEKYSKDATRIRTEDFARWLKRYKEANRQWVHLKREIAEKSNDTLDLYVQKKNSDLENSKLQLKMTHVNQINAVYRSELNNFNKMVLMAADIIQENYLILRNLGELDNSMDSKLQQLGKLLQGERNVKFADEEQLTASDHPEVLLNISDCPSDDTPSPIPGKKRANDDDLDVDSKKSKNSNVEDFQFLRPKALKSINFGPSTSESGDHDMNVTFDLKAPGPSSAKILGERSNRPAAVVPSIASRNTKTKFTLNVNKENKKFSPSSNRVKKLARTPTRVAGSRDARPKLVKSAVASSLVVPGKDKFKTLKKKL